MLGRRGELDGVAVLPGVPRLKRHEAEHVRPDCPVAGGVSRVQSESNHTIPAITAIPPYRSEIGGRGMARPDRKSGMKQVPVSEVKDDLSRYRIENDPRFLRRIEEARKSLRAGRGVKLEDIEP